MIRLVPASLMKALLFATAYTIWYSCRAVHFLFKLAERLFAQTSSRSRYAGKTVLVTTGRQAKTLHGVRALKEVGCRVVVTDYQEISASAVSTACDAHTVLAPLDPSKLSQWVDHLENIIRKEKVDLVLPMSTINEALFMGAAKDWLSKSLPHVSFACEGLEMMARLDNKALFAEMCKESGVPIPEDGVITSRNQLDDGSVPFNDMDVIIKRIESTVNRDEEIKIVFQGGKAPEAVQPTSSDPWQWQRFIRGTEYSAWFVCVEGQITFQGCYRSEGDLLFFDGIPVPEDVAASLGSFIARYKLSGQYAFDFFREDSTGKFFVIECNPRASSVLEGVSGTPGWGASFFGDDVRAATRYQQVGFWFHRNCWPFARGYCRSEGFWSWCDPLPIFIAEIAWPLEMLRIKGALRGGELSRAPKGIPIEAGIPLTAQYPSLCEALGFGYHHLDVNIGKIIVPGRTAGREYGLFEDIAKNPRAARMCAKVQQHGTAPSVLCAHEEVTHALASLAIETCKPSITRLADDPMEITKAKRFEGMDESIILGSPRATIQNLSNQSRSFDILFLSKQLLEHLPEGLVAPGGCVVEMESLPPVLKSK